MSSPIDAQRPNLVGQPQAALEAWLAELGEKPYRARQIMRWIYQRDVRGFDGMTDLSLDLRRLLQQRARIDIPDPVAVQRSADDTSKLLFRFASTASAEAVLIPDDERTTLCISSQAGCALACTFCQTGAFGAGRDLSSAEILGQVLCARARAAPRRISNLVFMGMGEPLLNLDQVLPAIEVITSELGLGLGAPRITLSTAGVIPGIRRLADAAPNIGLAISLNAASDELREMLMPINRRYPIAPLLDAVRDYRRRAAGRRAVTFEYVLLEKVNDNLDQAAALGRLLAPLGCKINLIPHNPIPDIPYRPPADDQVLRFQERVRRWVPNVTLRWNRGADIAAACGQLGARCAGSESAVPLPRSEEI